MREKFPVENRHTPCLANRCSIEVFTLKNFITYVIYNRKVCQLDKVVNDVLDFYETADKNNHLSLFSKSFHSSWVDKNLYNINNNKLCRFLNLQVWSI